ncbi:hypothetical protein BsWGS_25441 [Bradybaena similaris]
MNSLLLLTILVALVPLFFCLSCPYLTCEEELAEEPCQEVNEANCQGRIHRNASGCLGCCDVCYSIIAPGEKCYESDSYEYLDTECADGHFCDEDDTNVCQLKSAKNSGKEKLTLP